ILDRDDVAVADRRRRPRLLAESLHRLGVGHDLRAQQLDRELLLDVDVLGRVDLAHPALAELAHDAVATVEDLALQRGYLGHRPRCWWTVNAHEAVIITRYPDRGSAPRRDGLDANCSRSVAHPSSIRPLS